MKPEKVTIKTVALDAGVSVAAVSKVLRNAYGVSDSLRENVMTSIDRLGYRPSSAARGMRGSTYTVGILMDNVGNPFLPEILEGVNSYLRTVNYKSMLGVGRGEGALERSLTESMLDFHMDGLILVAPRQSSKELDAIGKQVPIVVIGHHEPTARSFDTVNSDDVNGARAAVKALIERGHRQIEMISLEAADRRDLDVFGQREIGYAQAMEEAGLGDLIRYHRLENLQDLGQDRAEAILAERGGATAFFCWSDLDAIQLINAARSKGVSVPEDLAIVGYDNSKIAALPLIDLTSVDQDGQLLGKVAAESLFSRIQGRKAANHILIEPTLVIRSSI